MRPGLQALCNRGSWSSFRAVGRFHRVETLWTCHATVVQYSKVALDQNPAQSQAIARSVATAGGTRKQAVDYTSLLACVCEIQDSWIPAKVEQVLMTDKSTLMLRLRTLEKGSAWLAVSWHPTAGRVCITDKPPTRGAAAEGYSLSELASGNLAGSVLTGIDMPQEWERVVRLQFGVRPGDPPSHHMHCEVMARYSNIVLSEANGTILACAHQVGGMMSSLRTLQTGRLYALPPIIQGIPPTSVTSLQEWKDTITKAAGLHNNQPNKNAATHAKLFDQSTPPGDVINDSTSQQQQQETTFFKDGCIRAFHGVSPSLINDFCRTSGVSSNVSIQSLTDQQWAGLWQAWQAWLARVASHSFAPSSDEHLTAYSMLGLLPVQHTSANELIDTYYSSLQASEQHAQLHQKLSSALAYSLKKARGKVFAFQAQLQDASRAETVQLQADMITANLYRILPDDEYIDVEDWTTGQPVRIKLDPTLTPNQVAEGLYRKARKLRRAVDAVEPLLEAAKQEVAYLEEVEESLAQLKVYEGPEDSRALQEIQDELVSEKYMKPPADAALAAKAAAKAQKAAKRADKGKGKKLGGAAGMTVTGGLGFRQFTSPGGYQVLVGRNNKQNDELSTVVAKADDLWLHLRGRPGSHTVIRVPSNAKQGPQLGDEDVQFAADLAAYFSKGRNDLKCDVMVAKASAVKKPKGAKPGSVMVLKELGNMVAKPGNSVAAQQSEQD